MKDQTVKVAGAITERLFQDGIGRLLIGFLNNSDRNPIILLVSWTGTSTSGRRSLPDEEKTVYQRH